mgnify:CR=1 FL=1
MLPLPSALTTSADAQFHTEPALDCSSGRRCEPWRAGACIPEPRRARCAGSQRRALRWPRSRPGAATSRCTAPSSTSTACGTHGPSPRAAARAARGGHRSPADAEHFTARGVTGRWQASTSQSAQKRQLFQSCCLRTARRWDGPGPSATQVMNGHTRCA